MDEPVVIGTRGTADAASPSLTSFPSTASSPFITMSDPIAVLLQGAMSSLAVAPADLASAMANPTFLPLLNQSLATIASKPQPQKLEIFEGNVPEIKRRIAQAKAEIERDKLLPVVELPFISREEDIAAVEAKREAVLRHHALGLETYLTGVSKPFSETHISQLRRSAFPSFSFLSCTIIR